MKQHRRCLVISVTGFRLKKQLADAFPPIYFLFSSFLNFQPSALLSRTYLGSSTKPPLLTLPSAVVGGGLESAGFDVGRHTHSAHAALFNSVPVHFDKAPLEWPCLSILPHQSPRTENKREIIYERLRRRSVISQPADGRAAICMQGSAVACDWVIQVAGGKSRNSLWRAMTPL